MTEDEAKTKMCPLLPISLSPNGVPLMTSYSYPGQPFTGMAAPVRQFNCVGSNCMMWLGHGCGLAR